VKKETLITAIVFLGIGFLAGFVFSARRSATLREQITATMASQSSSTEAADPDGASDELSGLPKGHPPLNDAEIIQFFKDAAAHNPSDPEPRLKLANFLYDRRQFAEAIGWYQQALQLDPRNIDARTDMATCYFNLGNAREALKQLQQALQVDPRHEPTLFNLIVVNLEGTHDVAAARKAWQRLEKINPNYPNLDRLKQSLDEANAAPSGNATSP
jgi:tetratricopeptide (TPR) repeat protein